MKLYKNKEYGNVLTYSEMKRESVELYDLFDDTSAVNYNEHYIEIEINE